MTDTNRSLFISVADYSQRMGQSTGLTRKQLRQNLVRHIRSGGRILIPHDEAERRYQEALASLDGVNEKAETGGSRSDDTHPAEDRAQEAR